MLNSACSPGKHAWSRAGFRAHQDEQELLLT